MSDSVAVAGQHDAFMAAFATEDPSAMAAVVTEDLLNMAPGLPRTVGRETARAFWGELFVGGKAVFTAPGSASDIVVSASIEPYRCRRLRSP